MAENDKNREAVGKERKRSKEKIYRERDDEVGNERKELKEWSGNGVGEIQIRNFGRNERTHR